MINNWYKAMREWNDFKPQAKMVFYSPISSKMTKLCNENMLNFNSMDLNVLTLFVVDIKALEIEIIQTHKQERCFTALYRQNWLSYEL